MFKTLKSAMARTRSTQQVLLLRLTLFFIIAALLYFFYWLFYARHYVSTDNAYVNGNIIPVTALVGGTIVAVDVNDTSYVHTGQPLVRLDDTDRQIAYTNAKAELALTLRQTQQLYIKNKGLLATIKQRQLNLKQASLDLKRRQQAIHVGGISQEELNHAQDAFQIQSSLLTNAQVEWRANNALINGVAIREHPNVKKAITNLREAYLNLIRTTIKAPVSGYIAKRSAQIGQVVAPGNPLMAIVPLEDLWVDANFKERQLRDIKAGQKVTLHADIYGRSVTYHGWVYGFSGGTGTAFSLLPAQNATGNWIKIAQRLPVRIALNPAELRQHPLRIGLSMEVTVDRSSMITSQPTINYANSTTIFKDLDAGVDKVIDDLFQKNLHQPSEEDDMYLITPQGKPLQ